MKTRITILAALLFSMQNNNVKANTLIVENTSDSGPESLRQTIFDANSGDTIRFNPNLISGGNATITLTSEINWTDKGLTIIGLYNSSDTLFISGNNTNRIFNVNLNTAAPGEKYLTLDSLAFKNGTVTGNGGAINTLYITDTLTISNSYFTGNHATNSSGGAVSANQSPTKLLNTIFTNNSSSAGGAASIRDFSTSNISNCTFTNNEVIGNNGGAIFIWGYSGSTIDGSTFNENIAGNGGGALYVGDHCPIAINTSTFYDNEAPFGTLTAYVFCDFSVTNSTIHNNSSSGFRMENNSYLDLTSSIVSENTLGSLTAATSFTSGGFNAFSDAPTGSNTTIGDLINLTLGDLNLQPLANNGGYTQTMLPGVGSVAIDAGSSDLSGAQNRPIVGTRDIGAGEKFCSVSTIFNKTECGNTYTWINGETYTSNNNTATFKVYNTLAGACDTTYTLDLIFSTPPDATASQNGTTLSANTSGVTYQWVDCDNANAPISGETNQTFTAIENGNYAVEVTENGCTETSDCMTVAGLGINANQNGNSELAKIYPNPTTNNVFVQINNANTNNYTVNIYNLVGEIVLTQNINTTTTQINTSQLENGVYFIEINNQNSKQTLRLVKQ